MRRNSLARYNKAMLGDLAPLYNYMRRYRWQYVQGTLACVATNIVAVQFPRILGMAIEKLKGAPTPEPILFLLRILRLPADQFNSGTARETILIFALILVGISLVKGVFLYAQ